MPDSVQVVRASGSSTVTVVRNDSTVQVVRSAPEVSVVTSREGPAGPTGAAGIADDASVAALLADPGSDTRTAGNDVYAPTGLPAGMSGAGRYNPDNHLYMPAGAKLVTLPAKLAGVRAGSGRAKIAVVGASNVAGWNGAASLRGFGDYPYQFSSHLLAAGYDTAEPVFTFQDRIAADQRITGLTGTWSYTRNPNDSIQGLLGSPSATLTVAAKRSSDTVEIAFHGGSITIAIDGVAISGVGAATVVNGTWSSPFATADGGSHVSTATVTVPKGPHTITVTCIHSIGVYWIDAYLAGAGASVANFGSSGTKTADWLDTSQWYTLIERVLAWGPDAVLLDCGIQFNSWQDGESLATSLANLETVAGILTAAGVEVLLMGLGPAVSPVTGTPSDAFYQNLFTLADATGLPLLELFSAWGSSETVAEALGLVASVDHVHPTQAGFASIARLLAAAVGVSPWRSKRQVQPGSAVATTSFTLVTGDTFQRCNPAGDITAALPTAPDDGSVVTLRQIGTGGRVTVTAGGSDLIGTATGTNVTSVALASAGQVLELMYFAAAALWVVRSSSHSLLTDPFSEPLYHPADSGLLATNFDPGQISATAGAMTAGSLILMLAKVPANKPITNIWLVVPTAGVGLTAGTSNLAAVYEMDGTRAGVTADQATNWQSAGAKSMALTTPITATPYARKVWVAMIAAGTTLPKQGYNGGSTWGGTGLLSGAFGQVAGFITGQTTCPTSITPSAMAATFKYWVGLS